MDEHILIVDTAIGAIEQSMWGFVLNWSSVVSP